MTIKRGKSSQKSFSSPLTTRSSRKRSSTGKFSEKSIEQNYSEPAPLEEHDKFAGCFIFCCHLSFNSTLVAQHMQLSRKRLFKVIREALSVAEDYVETGCPSVPLPKQLFTLKPMENFIDSSEASNSEVSLELSSKNDSFLAIKFPEKTKIFKLPKKVCAWTSEDECMSSSVETLSEEELPVVEREKSEDLEEEATDDYSLDEETDFYKPDMRTPPRFQPSKESLDESSSTFLDSNVDSSDDESGDASWVASQHRLPKVPCSSTVEVENRNSAPSEKRKEEEVLQAWFDYHLWQVRKHDMEDPSKGASFSVETMKEPSETLIDKNERDRIELASYLRGKEEETKELRENVFVNTCVLLAIKQFIFDYFYESFHFFLLTTAFRQRHNFITQKLNTEWCVPKNFKGQLKKPVPRKIKKPKIEKERKPKKEKKEKKEKKDKVSSKKDKKSTKSDKKSDKASKKKEKQDKKVHLAKEPSKTKEEKEEMARMQRELKEQEEERRKADENKRFMFPLTEAATDKFFQSIFEDWIPPKAREKSGKLKTDKGGKEAKRGKSKESGRSEKSKDGKKKGSKEGKGKKK